MSTVAMVVFSTYPFDPRVRREAEALAAKGISVDVICLQYKDQILKENVDGVNVYRIPLKRKRLSKLRYLREYTSFFLVAFFKLTLLHIKKRYKVVQVHNMPDILVLTALVPRITGAKIILDLHDPTPEVYRTKYSLPINHPMIRFLIFLERLSILFSDLVLTPNIAFLDVFISRSCTKNKIHVVMNSPDESIFHKEKTDTDTKPNNNDPLIIMYHGFIAERNGLGTALDAINIVRDEINGIIFHVYGDGDYRDQFLHRVAELNLKDIVKYHGAVPLEIIAEKIKSIDIGIIPNNKTPFTDINLPTRIFEYLSMGKPVIAPSTKGILDYFNDGSLFFFEPGNMESLAEKIIESYNKPEYTKSVLSRGISVFDKYRWEIERKHYVDIVKKLIGISSSQQEENISS